MKKQLLVIALLFITIIANGQIFGNKEPKIDANVINRISTLYLSERYKDCIDSCQHYLGNYRYFSVGYESHPYRDWRKIQGYWESNDVEDVANVLYLGCVAAYQYSLSQFDTRSIFDGIEWARSCVAIYDDYLHERIPNSFATIEAWAKYIQYSERALSAAQCGDHFLAVGRDDRCLKKQGKWFDKESDRITDVLYKAIEGKDYVFSNYPVLQYKVYLISSSQIIKKGRIKVFQDVFKKRVDAFERMVQICQQNDISNFEIPIALNSLISTLTTTIVENEFCKKAGPNYERFCMENLIKLQEISYSLNGSNRYSQSPSYTLRDIQNSLEETDCAIFHFEAPVASGRLYFQYDLGTRYRNYALIITKDQETPDVWHRGYIKDNVVNDLSRIREAYPRATRFYYVGTPRMSFIDIAGNDSSIVRLHSLSQLLQKRSNKIGGSEVTFIGDLDYTKVGKLSPFGPLIGSAEELAYINTLYSNVRPICGDDATRNVVTSEISRSNGIVHISTHGELFSPNDDFTPEELILKKNVMENSCLILSGYNDTPNSSLCYMSGSDVLKIKRINSELVFLDACMSGKGAVGVTGSVGIAEAFHLIGAKNVICYLGPIDDDIATEFSNRFYLELSKGASCHDAFFRAKKFINHNLKVVLWE